MEEKLKVEDSGESLRCGACSAISGSAMLTRDKVYCFARSPCNSLSSNHLAPTHNMYVYL